MQSVNADAYRVPAAQEFCKCFNGLLIFFFCKASSIAFIAAASRFSLCFSNILRSNVEKYKVRGKKASCINTGPALPKNETAQKARKRNFVECAMLDVAKNDESKKVKTLVFCQRGIQTSFNTWDIVLSSRQTKYSTSLPSSPPSLLTRTTFFLLKYQS